MDVSCPAAAGSQFDFQLRSVVHLALHLLEISRVPVRIRTVLVRHHQEISSRQEG